MSRHADNSNIEKVIDFLSRNTRVAISPTKVKRRFNNFVDKLVAFDYSKLIPEYKIVRNYQNFAFGVEFTLRYCGPGIGFGLGKVDRWIGWPFDRK